MQESLTKARAAPAVTGAGRAALPVLQPGRHERRTGNRGRGPLQGAAAQAWRHPYGQLSTLTRDRPHRVQPHQPQPRRIAGHRGARKLSRRPWLGIRRESDVLAGQRLLGHDLPAFCGQVVDRDVRVNADHTAALRWQDISPERSGPADPSSPTNGAAVRTTPSRASSTTPRPGRWTSRGSACAPSKAEGVKAFDPLIAPFEVTDGLDDRRTPDERRHSDAARGLGELAVTIVPCPRGGPQPVGGGALGSAGFHAVELLPLVVVAVAQSRGVRRV